MPQGGYDIACDGSVVSESCTIPLMRPDRFGAVGRQSGTWGLRPGMLLGVRQLATVGAVREVEFKLLHFICNSSDSAVPRVRSALRYQPGPRTKSSMLQILPHTAHARRVTLSQRLTGGDGPQSRFVVNEATPSRVKRLPVR